MLNSPPWDFTGDILTTDDQTKTAVNMAKISYSPYSNRPFGVALVFNNPLLGEPDIIVPGKNLENAAYNPSITATRGAFSLANIMGIDVSTLKEIVVVEATCCTKDQHPAERKDEVLDLIRSINPAAKMTYIPINIKVPKPSHRSFTINKKW